MLSELKEYLDKQEDNFDLFSDIEKIIGKPLGGSLIQDIIMLQDKYAFDNERIKELFRLLKEKDCYRSNYIIKVADTWQKSDIVSVDQSKKSDSERFNSISEDMLSIFSALGILPRLPEEYEEKYCQVWIKEWGMELPLIIEACKTAVEKTNSPSFPYTNAILKNWHDSNITTMQAYKAFHDKEQEKRSAQTERQKKKNSFHNFEERHYDYDELMKIVSN